MTRRTLVALALLGCSVAHAVTPTFPEVQARYIPSEAWLLDRHGAVIQSMRIDAKVRRLPWVKLDDISPTLKLAVLTAEDKRFDAHDGVDWRAMLNAAWGNARGRPTRGASTISMQVAALLDADLQAQSGRRMLSQKWDQIGSARDLERTWSKAQILEAYFNLVSFRGEVQGIGAAAQVLLNKAPSGLSRDEAVVLAALIRNPNASTKILAQRACALATELQAAQDCELMRVKVFSLLAPHGRPGFWANDAPELAQQLLNHAGTQVRSTLDANLQRDVEAILREQILTLREHNVRDGAAIVIDNASGDVLAYVANVGDAASARHVDGVRALRQAGSTLKPFLYGLALERRLLTSASILDDSPVNLVTPTGLYVPQNYDNDFKGPVSARTALASSLNVPAVRTLMLVGIDRFHQRLRDFGFESLTEPGEYYGYSLALGSAEVRLSDLANAYRSLANGGRFSPLRYRLDEVRVPARRVMDEAAAFIVSDILADRQARSVTFGLENPLATRRWSAVKTGTSKDMRDNWCAGFSERYTVAVWVGNFDGEPMWQVSGVTGAAPVWLTIMNRLHASLPNRAPHTPSNVVQAAVRFDSEIEPARNEWFIKGTQRNVVALVPSEERAARIGYPGSGSILAFDPDIPTAQQRVLFSANRSERGSSWRLNDAPLGSAETPYAWEPRPGVYRLVLLDAAGAQLDQVRFEVRGAPTPK